MRNQAIIGILCASAAANPPAQRLMAGDPVRNGSFGLTVDIDAGTLVIGEDHDKELGDDAGAAYVFEMVDGKWTQRQKLLASDGAARVRFGRPVAIGGDTIAATGNGVDSQGRWTHSVYVFEREDGAWKEVDRLHPSDLQPYSQFGQALAIDGDVLVVSDPTDDSPARNVGAVYIYHRVDGRWTKQVKLQPPRLLNDTEFGHDVDICGDVIVIGSNPYDYQSVGRYVVWVYERVGDEWVLQAEVAPAGQRVREGFGTSVAIDDSTLLVGAPFNDFYGRASGAAYVFERQDDAWVEVDMLTPLDGDENDLFGRHVALHGSLAAINASNDEDHYGWPRGAVYVFERIEGVWHEILELEHPGGSSFGLFGYGIGVSGPNVVAGSPWERNDDGSHGAAFAHRIGDCPADIDCDDDVDVEDFFAFLDAFTSGEVDRCDLDRDGLCNPDDFFRFLDHYSLGC